MSNGRAESAGGETHGAMVRGWRLLAAGAVVGGLALLGGFGGLGFELSGLGSSVASVGRSLAAGLHAPGRDGPAPRGPGWRHTPADAVLFRGGYFCVAGPSGRRVQLVLALRELDTFTQGSSIVAGPFSSEAQMGGTC